MNKKREDGPLKEVKKIKRYIKKKNYIEIGFFSKVCRRKF